MTFDPLELLIKQVFPYEVIRPKQMQAIKAIIKAYKEGKRQFILEAPTGTGKSAIAYTVHRLIEKFRNPEVDGPYRGVILTKTKSLQVQYSREFNDIPTLYSSTNYDCNLVPKHDEHFYRSSNCPKQKCPAYSVCYYQKARNAFLQADAGVLNYAYYLTAGSIYRPKYLVIDEAHTIDNYLCDHFAIKLNLNHLNNTLERLEDVIMTSTTPLYMLVVNLISVIETNKEWLELCQDLITDHYDVIKEVESLITTARASCVPSADMEEEERKALKGRIMTLDHSMSFIRKLLLLLVPSTSWIIDNAEDEHSTQLKPTDVRMLCQDRLFNGVEFTLLMSATICGIKEFAEELGIKPHEYDSMSLDCDIPAEQRKIHLLNLPALNYQNKHAILPYYAEVIDYILSNYPTSRGIIHTTSYENAEFLLKNCKGSSKRMMIPTKRDLMDVEKLMKKAKDRILVSPSLIEGIDLKGDLSKVQIFLKVPFMNLGDAWVVEKQRMSNKWYTRQAVLSLIQGCGRSVRSETDSADTFILDGAAVRLFESNLIPHWMQDAVEIAT